MASSYQESTSSSTEDQVPSASSPPSSSPSPELVTIADISIPTHENVSSLFSSYTYYIVKSVVDSTSYEVKRRYSDFYFLHRSVQEAPGYFISYFPKKNYFDRMEEELICFRQATFEKYLNKTKDIPFAHIRSILKAFLTMEQSEFKYYTKNFAPIKCKLPSSKMNVISKLFASLPNINVTGLKAFVDSLEAQEAEGDYDEEAIKSIGLVSEGLYVKGTELEEVCGELRGNLDECCERHDDLVATYEKEFFSQEAGRNMLRGIISDCQPESASQKIIINKEEHSSETENEPLVNNERDFPKSKEAQLMEFENCLRKLRMMNHNKMNFLSKSGDDLLKLQESTFEYFSGYKEIVRLNKQYERYNTNIFRAQGIINTLKYDQAKSGSGGYGRRQKVNAELKKLDIFIECQEKLKKVFARVFNGFYKDFSVRMSERIEEIISLHLRCTYEAFHKYSNYYERIVSFESGSKIEEQFPMMFKERKNSPANGDEEINEAMETAMY